MITFVPLEDFAAGNVSALECLFLAALYELHNQQHNNGNIASAHEGEGIPEDYILEDGWFRCQTEELTEHSGWSARQQSQLFRSLKKKGYVLLKRNGLPAKRWVKTVDPNPQEEIDDDED